MIERTNTDLSGTQLPVGLRFTHATARPAHDRCDLALYARGAENANLWVVLSLSGTADFILPGAIGNLDHRIAPFSRVHGGFDLQCSPAGDCSPA
jgi:hypothetical protein